MPSVRRSRTVPAAPPRVWKEVADPRRLRKWWPRATRAEGVADDHWTLVFVTKKGKTLRADYRVLEDDPPRRRSWYQELEASPFERLLSEHVTAVTVDEAPGGSDVTIEIRQRLRGISRLGSPIVRRASRQLIDEALDGLAAAVGR
ncbi:MAG: SRPBCC family protein [Solirubrobacteraceae bacterium]